MENSVFGVGFRRREMVRLAAVTGAALWTGSYAFAASDFWDKKKPAEWTDQEKDAIKTKSPWAKKVDAEMTGGGGRGSGGSGGGGGGGRGSRGGGGDSGGDDSGGGDSSGGGGRSSRGGGGGGGVAPAGNFGSQSVSLEVWWMSAKPIQDAHPLAFGPKLEKHYILAVSGIPQQVLNAVIRGGGARGGSGGRFGGRGAGQANAGPPAGSAAVDNAGPPPGPADPTAGLRRGASLVVKGKDPQISDVVMAMGQGTPSSAVLFGFAKDSLPLAVEDKEVEFELKLGGLSAKVKFNLKDMMYNGELAL